MCLISVVANQVLSQLSYRPVGKTKSEENKLKVIMANGARNKII